MRAKRKIGVNALTEALKENTQGWQNLLQRSNPDSKAKTVSKKKFACEYCKRNFVYMTGLTRHVAKFHPEKNHLPDPGLQTGETVAVYARPKSFDVVIKCVDCGEIFQDVKLFEAHSVRYNWEFMLSNAPDDVENMATTAFMQKLRIVVINTALLCEFCDACFSDHASLFYHEAHHSPTSGYACAFCKQNFFTLQTAVEHRVTCVDYDHFRATQLLNVGMIYSCNVCLSPFFSLSDLYEHRFKNHHYFPRRIAVLETEGKKFAPLYLSCELCGFTCNHISALLTHRSKHHSLTCPDDDGGHEADNSPTIGQPKRTAVKRVAERQESTSYRQFLCEKCGKTYTQSSHLWQHLRFHNGIRPFACTVQGCTRRFTIRPDLSDHIRKCHTGERPYQCEVCHKRFLTGSVFYQHRLIHRNERRHACEDCDRRFYRADALKNHRRIHTGEKPYACTHCDRKFRQRGDREKHVRVKHMKYH
ncbi:testis-specific zinc finger protein topi-like [Anopheles moucheti]|uniref:testis-specific zinc finger protein topi-like n=1 Tax=Anopheles moucheti TaxID=186751 RepID=UPI0022F0B88D|nr:testis-specific zinc finger protein topi-like [Anopheles moucheti]